MPLDSDSLGSLRIDRSAPASGGGGGKRLIFVGVTVAVLAAVAFGAWKLFGGHTTEVTTVVAEAESSGPSLGNSVLNASGYVVARRTSTVASKVTGRVLERVRRIATGDQPDELAQLTAQERKVLALVAEGKTNKEIGAEVFLSDKTVKNYVSSILSKLNLERRAQAAAFMARLRADQPGWMVTPSNRA